MNIRQKSDSESLVETISKFQDQIQDTRFAIASIKIESAFRIIMKIFDKKKIIVSVYFFSRLKHNSIKKVVEYLQRPIKMIFQNLEKARQRTIMKAFVLIKIRSQNNQSLRNKNVFVTPSKQNKKIIPVIEQIKSQDIEEEYLFLKEQIKKIQKSFQDFYNNLNRQ